MYGRTLYAFSFVQRENGCDIQVSLTLEKDKQQHKADIACYIDSFCFFAQESKAREKLVSIAWYAKKPSALGRHVEKGATFDAKGIAFYLVLEILRESPRPCNKRSST